MMAYIIIEAKQTQIKKTSRHDV